MNNEQYEEGFEAYNLGLDYSDNPYPSNSSRNEEWADGWTAAQEEMGDDDLEALTDHYSEWI